MARPPVRSARRAAFTLTELMVATAIVSMMAVTLGALTQAVRTSSAYSEGTSTAAQHARVALERIGRALREGYASEAFPGCAVFSESVGIYSYPDTLVVWDPPTTPADPAGLPRFSEIIVFCPNPSEPTQLLEIRSPSDTRSVPPLTNGASWASELATLKTGNTSTKVLLTDLLRTARPSQGSGRRGAVQFAVALRPSATEWAQFRAGTTTFQDLPWVQSIFGSNSGLRQTWLSTELQLTPPGNRGTDSIVAGTLGFFGSAALYWELSP